MEDNLEFLYIYQNDTLPKKQDLGFVAKTY